MICTMCANHSWKIFTMWHCYSEVEQKFWTEKFILWRNFSQISHVPDVIYLSFCQQVYQDIWNYYFWCFPQVRVPVIYHKREVESNEKRSLSQRSNLDLRLNILIKMCSVAWDIKSLKRYLFWQTMKRLIKIRIVTGHKSNMYKCLVLSEHSLQSDSIFI